MITEQLKNGLRNTFHETILKKSIFSESEIIDLTKKLFSNWQSSRTYQGGKFLFDDFTPYMNKYLLDLISEKIPEGVPGTVLPWSEVHIDFSNIYVTSSEYGLQTDAFQEWALKKNKISFKNIIIPLGVCGKRLEEENINNVIFMKNRYINYDSSFQKNPTNEWFVQMQKNIVNYDDLEWFDDKGEIMNIDSNKQYITDEQYITHLSSLERQVLDGFIIEKIAKFDVGNMIIHDSCQTHVTGNMRYKNSAVTNKMGVRLSIVTDLSNII